MISTGDLAFSFVIGAVVGVAAFEIAKYKVIQFFKRKSN